MSSRMEGTAASPRTVDEARDAVEQSRQRISSTLDSIENRIVDKKHELQDRADVLRPVREQVVQRPFTAVAVAVAAGALLGSLGGSRHQESRVRPGGRIPGGEYLDDDARAELREWRRNRRERLRGISPQREDEGHSRFDDVKGQLVGALTSAIGAAVTARVKQLAMGSPASGDGRYQ